MNIIIAFLIVISGIVGGFVSNKLTPTDTGSYDNGSNEVQLGVAASFPTSIYSVTDINPTDPVNNPSHSTRHNQAVAEIGALETKLGIGASTAVSGTVLGATGAGSSSWLDTISLAGITATNATTTNLLALGSTTLQNFTFVNATGTSATTTNLFVSNNASTTNFYGSGLTTCTGSNILQWTGGRFSCGSTAGSVTVISTTTAQNLATTTFRTANSTLPSGENLKISMTVPYIVGNGATTTADVIMALNGDTSTTYAYSRISAASHANTTNSNWIVLSGDGGDGRFQRYFKMDINNFAGMPKVGSYDTYVFGTTTTPTVNGNIDGEFFWDNTDAITQIDIWWDTANVQFATSTKIRIEGY